MKISNFKAGSFQSKDAYNYQYFLPNTINHQFEIDNSELQIQLEKSIYALGGLNAMTGMVDNIYLFISSFINQEAHHSNKIEGTQTLIEDSFKREEDIKIEQKNDWLEVRLYIKSIKSAITKLDTMPISSRLIKETHKILLASGRGKNKTQGDFRISQNWIGGDNLNNADFIPPHKNFVPELMSDLEKFLHNQNLVPDIVKIAIIHYQFETIHPFLDGNGRVGRILIPLYLVDKKLLSKPLLYMSSFFEKNKKLYYDKLMQVRIKNDLTGWLLFFLRGIEQTANHSIEILKKTLKLKSKLTTNIMENTGNRSSNNIRLLDKLFTTPFIRVDDVRQKLEVSGSTAKNIVDDLVRVKILQELTENKRNRLFAFSPYLKLLNEPFPNYE